MRQAPPTPRLIVPLLAVLAAGVPVSALLWDTLNHLLSGHLQPRRLALALPLAVAFVYLLTLLARLVGRADPRHS